MRKKVKINTKILDVSFSEAGIKDKKIVLIRGLIAILNLLKNKLYRQETKKFTQKVELYVDKWTQLFTFTFLHDSMYI